MTQPARLGSGCTAEGAGMDKLLIANAVFFSALGLFFLHDLLFGKPIDRSDRSDKSNRQHRRGRGG